MKTECITDQFEFEGFERRRVIAAFDGGRMEQLRDRTEAAYQK